jgi:hypothetical protein
VAAQYLEVVAYSLKPVLNPTMLQISNLKIPAIYDLYHNQEGVNPNLWICPFDYCKVAFFEPTD